MRYTASILSGSLPYTKTCSPVFPFYYRATLTAQAKELEDRLASKSESLEQVFGIGRHFC